MRHLDLFSGIGGFALATEMVWDNVEHVFCDNEPFAQAVLKKHWPNSDIHGDIKTLNTKALGEFDLITGGFPCQPFSTAGRRAGTEDDRHLWPAMLAVIQSVRPRWVIGENVGGLVTWNGGMVLEQIYADLEGAGYEVQAFIIPAVGVNAPHRRDRIWIIGHATGSGGSAEVGAVRKGSGPNGRGGDRHVAHAIGNGARGAHGRAIRSGERGRQDSDKRQGHEVRGNASDRDSQRRDTTNAAGGRWKQSIPKRQAENNLDWRNRREEWEQNWIEVATRLCVMDDGVSRGLVRPRGWRNAALKGAGNAIVPQVAAQIMRAIKQIDYARD